jgi:hypothetical protein
LGDRESFLDIFSLTILVEFSFARKSYRRAAAKNADRKLLLVVPLALTRNSIAFLKQKPTSRMSVAADMLHLDARFPGGAIVAKH